MLHHQLHQELDAARVLPFEILCQIVQHRHQRAVGAVVVAFAPTRDALIGIDGQDNARALAVSRHKGPQLRDLHCASSPGVGLCPFTTICGATLCLDQPVRGDLRHELAQRIQHLR
jgi:hypothetical protein